MRPYLIVFLLLIAQAARPPSPSGPPRPIRLSTGDYVLVTDELQLFQQPDPAQPVFVSIVSWELGVFPLNAPTPSTPLISQVFPVSEGRVSSPWGQTWYRIPPTLIPLTGSFHLGIRLIGERFPPVDPTRPRIYVPGPWTISTETVSRPSPASTGLDITGGTGTDPNDNATPLPPLLTYVLTDTTTAGAWRAPTPPLAYGAAGWVVAGDSATSPTLPLDTRISLVGNAAAYTWASASTDPRALQRPAPASTGDRLMAAWYSDAGFVFDVTVSGSTARQISLYAADFDPWGRAQTYDVLDPVSNLVLDSRPLSNFTQGAWVSWMIRGHYLIRVTRTVGPNAVVSGIFVK